VPLGIEPVEVDGRGDLALDHVEVLLVAVREVAADVVSGAALEADFYDA
jgi:hypothetical protein